MDIFASYDFNRSEFACKCGCGFDTVDIETLQVLQKLRDHYGMVCRINSGCRCYVYNKQIGGSDRSQHVLGRAADFVIVGIHPDMVADRIDSLYPDRFGAGRYDSFTHFDTRTIKARWDKRT